MRNFTKCSRVGMFQLERRYLVKKPKEVLRVINQLPTQEIRKVELDDGTVVNLVTTDEALTEILTILREIE